MKQMITATTTTKTATATTSKTTIIETMKTLETTT